MGKVVKNIISYFFIAFFLIFIMIITANEIINEYKEENLKKNKIDLIDNINITATIMKNGDIKVNQKWEVNTEIGTEYTIPLLNLNKIKITDIHVSDLNGDYEEEKNWNILLSKQKAKKYGINTIDEGSYYELCFGKTTVGHNIYNIQFTYKNAVTSFKDYDALTINFINKRMEPTPRSVTTLIGVEDEAKFTNDNVKIWKFGYDAEIKLLDGKIYIKNITDYNSAIRLTLRLNKGILNNLAKVSDYTFEEAVSSYQKQKEKEHIYKNANNIIVLISILPTFLMTLIIPFEYIRIKRNRRALIYDKRITKEKYPYWRDDIYCKNILIIHLTQDIESFKNLISAQMLIWIKNGVIELKTEEIEKETNGMNKTVKEDRVYIKKKPAFVSIFEQNLYTLFLRAKKDKDYLTLGDIQQMNVKDYSQYYKMQRSARKEAIKLATEYGYIDKNLNYIEATEKGIEEAEKYYGFERFLKDFTLISEKRGVEIELWDEILIIATAIGKGISTLKELKDVLPNYEYTNLNNTINKFDLIDNGYSSTINSKLTSRYTKLIPIKFK